MVNLPDKECQIEIPVSLKKLIPGGLIDQMRSGGNRGIWLKISGFCTKMKASLGHNAKSLD
jgi:hypothetical protein